MKHYLNKVIISLFLYEINFSIVNTFIINLIHYFYSFTLNILYKYKCKTKMLALYTSLYSTICIILFFLYRCVLLESGEK